MIVIIDYGMGNLLSVYNKYHRLGIECMISSNIYAIEIATKLILPGVGHYKYGMDKLKQLNLIDILQKKVMKEKTPILGICLGVQLFASYSEEGKCKGLGWIDAEVVRFKVSDPHRYKVPHMGWNTVRVTNPNTLDAHINDADQFYFVHSYHLKCNNPSDTWMTTSYDYEFVSAINSHNIYGTQFHPEKSHDAGISLIKEFGVM